MDINELESFKLSDAVSFHEELNPQLWNEGKLDPEVRDQLLLIAEDFVEYLGLSNLKVKDVTISGSNAAYSYTPHSDLDLHILVDFNELPNNEVYQELFTAKKTLYNDLHDITVREVPVELYVQDTNQVHTSLGEYSVVYDKWIRIPKKRRANFDEAATKAKYEKLGDLIELALKTQDPKRVNDTLALIKRYRKSGLEKAGEFGPENLAFKAVRKQGLIQDLHDLKAQLHGEKLSIEESDDKQAAVLKIQKHLNKKYGANLDLDGKLGPLTLKSINKFMPRAKTGLADEPNKTTAVQGKKVKVKEYVDDIKSYRNPSPKTLHSLTKRSAHKHMRGMYHNGDTYWWDANDAIHSDGSKLLGIPYDYLNRLEAAIDNVSGNYYVGGDDGVPAEIMRRYDVEELAEASGYIPSAKEKNDPRFKTALTVDVNPDSIKKNANAFNWKTSRAGIPPQARADGKIAEDLMREFKSFLLEDAHPKVGYHVTATKNLPVIRKNGINADRRGNSYVWDSLEMAEWFTDFQNDEGQDRTILKIDMTGIDARPDPEAEDMSEWSSRFKPGTNGGAWIVSGAIPPDKIIG
jgi:predicted nucleotidyltransferase